MDDVTAAKHLVRLLDLTSLNNDDTESRIEKLCAKAQTPYGNVAAVCIYPKFLPLAKSLTAPASNLPRSSTSPTAAAT